ncbi:hypothetical protein NDU88_002922 [Pleurodeles waltl]|uniref:Uncharacterized protein n=1 Tax=Pleurodeles waltl TaxID=8319 RepID=A0AAV7QA91_PLEWA|nr:hypothetical protein NDU88_002922 [Pleurodeles waltl]
MFAVYRGLVAEKLRDEHLTEQWLRVWLTGSFLSGLRDGISAEKKVLEALRLLKEAGRLDMVREEALGPLRPARRAGWQRPF